MTLKLYYAPGACSLAALSALEASGADFEPIRLILADGEQRSPDYLCVNPRGRVPTLVLESGQVVTETIAILTYVAHRYPEAQLLPFQDLGHLARAFELMSWFASGAHVSIAQIWRGDRFTDEEPVKAALRVSGLNNALKAFDELEAICQAERGDWILGDQFSVLDPYALVFWRWARRLEADTAAYPAWSEKSARALAHPAVKAAIARETAPLYAAA